MKTSKEMQALVYLIAGKHKFDLEAPNAYLKVNLDEELAVTEGSHIPLIIQRLNPTILSLSHEFVTGNGEIVADPEVLFYTGFTEWVAIQLTQPASNITTQGRFGGHRKYVDLEMSGKYIKNFDPAGQKALANYVKSWYKNLKDDGWDKYSKNAVFVQTRFPVDPQPRQSGPVEAHPLLTGPQIYILPGGQTL